jgi:hypothetical protein
MRAFVDIGVGSKEKYEKERASYENTVIFLRETSAMLGIDPGASPCSLSPELREMTEELAQSNPQWSKYVFLVNLYNFLF